MKYRFFSFAFVLFMAVGLTSCLNNDPIVVRQYRGVYMGIGSDSDTAVLVVNPNGYNDFVGVKRQSDSINITTMIEINTLTGVGTFPASRNGGWSGVINFRRNQMTLTQTRDSSVLSLVYSLSKLVYPNTLAGYWKNSNGDWLDVILYPYGISDRGTLFSAKDGVAHYVIVGAIDRYGQGVMRIDNTLVSFQLSVMGTTTSTTIDFTYDGTSYTLSYSPSVRESE